MNRGAYTQGFTLIEMAISLVVAGLIVGGVLVGQELLASASIRAQITQIDRYNAAVSAFSTKYGYLPGDITASAATKFGFAARGPYRGQGDGNGLLDGIDYNSAVGYDNMAIFSGELAMFWVDLSQAGLIDATFNTATATAIPGSVSGSALANYFPAARIGRGNYVAVWSGGPNVGGFQYTSGSGTNPHVSNGINYFAVAAITNNANTGDGVDEEAYANTTIKVIEAYTIDKKIDDGYPQSGQVQAMNIGGWGGVWSGGNNTVGAFDPQTGAAVVAGDGIATPPTANTCYDNGNVAGATEKYSVTQSGGSGSNCALSFQFQN